MSTIPKSKPGRTSQYKPLLDQLVSGKKKYLKFSSRSNADNCATYFRGHYHQMGVIGVAAVRKIDDEFRVYVEVIS